MFGIDSLMKKKNEITQLARNVAKEVYFQFQYIDSDKTDQQDNLLTDELNLEKKKNKQLIEKIKSLQNTIEQNTVDFTNQIKILKDNQNIQPKNTEELIRNLLSEYKEQLFQEVQTSILDQIQNILVLIINQIKEDPEFQYINLFELLEQTQNNEMPVHQIIFNKIDNHQSQMNLDSFNEQILSFQQQIEQLKLQHSSQLQQQSDTYADEIIKISRQVQNQNQEIESLEKYNNEIQINITQQQNNNIQRDELLLQNLNNIVQFYDNSQLNEQFLKYKDKKDLANFFKCLQSTIEKTQSCQEDIEIINQLQVNKNCLQKEIQELQRANQDLKKQFTYKVQSIQNDFNDQLQTISEQKNQIKGLTDEIKIISQQEDNLKQKFKSVKQELESYQDQSNKVQQLQQQVTLSEEQAKQFKNQIKIQENQLKDFIYENSQLQSAIQNLQIIYEESVDKQVIMEEKYLVEIQKLKQQINNQERFQKQLNDIQNETNQKDQQILNFNKDIENYKHKLRQADLIIEQNKSELLELVKKIKNEQQHKENLIDKRVISKFLVNYFDMNSDYQVKVQILETLSSILSFTEEDQKKIGIYRENLRLKLEKPKEKCIEEVENIEDKLALFLLQQD